MKMRRSFVKSFGPIRSAFLHHGEKISTGVAKRSYVNNGNFNTSSYNMCKCGLPSYMFSRISSSNADMVLLKKVRPMVPEMAKLYMRGLSGLYRGITSFIGFSAPVF
ncbi:unnamed protein product [Lactuca virosa]|uniref:Uncharacterized protein n=1 Tax=Lactuca virosa TaxID=75947 RepID=A0AAU9N6V2_9ASTR|nr:unnamed protein product [Lactuca virosa]